MSLQQCCFVVICLCVIQKGFCKEKVGSHNVVDGQDMKNSWSSWEPASKTAGLNWSPAPDLNQDQPVKQKSNKSQKSPSTSRQTKSDPDFGIGDIQKLVLRVGKNLFSNFMTGSSFRMPWTVEKRSSEGRQSEQHSEGWRGKEEGRGAVDWLARLIGVEGKSLGEFLREYQVHVLYDLVFTFFKWIFFIYAGLLIP